MAAPLCVALAPRQFGWDTEPFAQRAKLEAATVRAVTKLVRNHGARIVVVTQSTATGLEDDSIEVARLLAHLPSDVTRAVRQLPAAESVEDAIAQYAEADVLYAYRLHAAIISLFAGTPSLVIDYEPKVRGVLSTIGLGDWVMTSEEAQEAETVRERLLVLATAAESSRIPQAIEHGRRLASPFVGEVIARLRGVGRG